MKDKLDDLVTFLIVIALFGFIFMFFSLSYAYIAEYSRQNNPETPKKSIEYINTAPAKEAIKTLGDFMRSLEIGDDK